MGRTLAEECIGRAGHGGASVFALHTNELMPVALAGIMDDDLGSERTSLASGLGRANTVHTCGRHDHFGSSASSDMEDKGDRP